MHPDYKGHKGDKSKRAKVGGKVPAHEKGKWAWHAEGNVWKRIADLNESERRAWLRNRMHRVLHRALIGFGSDEVSDALVACIDDAIDKKATDDEMSQGEGRREPSDSMAALFREVLHNT